MSCFIWAAIKKYHRLSGLDNKHLFLAVLETGRGKVKVPADWSSGESPLPGSQTASCLLPMTSHGGKGQEGCLEPLLYGT